MSDNSSKQSGEGYSRRSHNIDYDDLDGDKFPQEVEEQPKQEPSSKEYTTNSTSSETYLSQHNSENDNNNNNNNNNSNNNKNNYYRNSNGNNAHHRQPQSRNSQNYRKRSRASYEEQLQLEIEELESRYDLRPADQSRLEQLHAQLEATYNRQSSGYSLPEVAQSKSDLLHGRGNHQRNQLDQHQQHQQQTYRTENWEAEQFNRAQLLNLQTDDKIHINNDKQYEYVFDESQFVNYEEDEELSGDEREEEEEQQQQQQQEEEEEEDEAEKKKQLQRSLEAKEIADVQHSLPVYKFRDEFLRLISENQVLIVVGETGSGKTTQLPQYLYQAGYSQNDTKIIGCTQPRRVAATSVAQRVAQEMQEPLGEKVGYTVRFDDKSSRNTRIKYLTDGMLLREFLNNPEMDSYGAIMIDEAHERTLSTEILLSLLKDLTNSTRSDLKIIIASATINATKFSEFFNNAPILNIPGRRFPVKIHYTKQPEANYLQAVMTTIFQIHLTQPLPGDILVFLTGQEEIESLEQQMQEAIVKLGDQLKEQGKIMVCSIYANLPNEQQQRIFEPTPPFTRKLVLATNIAETSITIPGVSYVIDPGYVKQTEFNPHTGMESLLVVPCSKANCDQRAGRAGRIGPGKCFRIFTKHSFDNEMEMNTKPEIERINLNSVVLLLLSLGINDLIKFPFLDPPNRQSIIKSLSLLYQLGGLNSRGELTRTGMKMSEFPLDPTYAKCILSSERFGITKEICIIIAMLTESSNLYYIPKKLDKEVVKKRHEQFVDKQGDHLTLLNVYKQWAGTGGYSNQWCQDYFIQYKTMKRVRDIYKQLIGICSKVGITVREEQKEEQEEEEKREERDDGDVMAQLVQKCLITGFINNIVKLSPMGDCYERISIAKKKEKNNNGSSSNHNTANKANVPCYIHPSSSLFKRKNPKPRYLMYYELVLTSKEYMRNCLILDEKLIREYQH